jgi:hypothetical protein
MRFALVAYYLAAALLCTVLVYQAFVRELAAQELYAEQSVGQRTDSLLRRVAETLSFRLYRGASDEEARLDGLITVQQRSERTILGASAAYLTLTLALLALLIARRQRLPPATLPRQLVLMSVGFLAVGLLAPMLRIVVSREVAVLGSVVLTYQNKGIVSTIAALATLGHLLPAALLALFGVALPLAKVALTLLALARPWGRRVLTSAWFEVLSRLSFVDVVAVAILVVFLTFQSDVTSDATLGIGLYYFAGYGVLALAATIVLALLERGGGLHDGGAVARPSP